MMGLAAVPPNSTPTIMDFRKRGCVLYKSYTTVLELPTGRQILHHCIRSPECALMFYVQWIVAIECALMFYVHWIVAIEVCSNVLCPLDSGDRGVL